MQMFSERNDHLDLVIIINHNNPRHPRAASCGRLYLVSENYALQVSFIKQEAAKNFYIRQFNNTAG
jgi:hypothetical protein